MKAALWSVGTAAVWAWAALALIAGPFFFGYQPLNAPWSTTTDWTVMCGVGCGALAMLLLAAGLVGSVRASRRTAAAAAPPRPAPVSNSGAAMHTAPAPEPADRNREIRRLAAFTLQQLEHSGPEDSHPGRTIS